MRLLGSNARFGARRVNLSGNRYVQETFEKGEPFPRGVRGMLPVVTLRKGGAHQTTYAFATAGDAPDEPAPGSAADALSQAVRLVNETLDRAAELTDVPFGIVDDVRVGIPAQGQGFSHVAYAPYDRAGAPAATPVHLRLETSEVPGSANSLSATIGYDPQGAPTDVTIVAFQTPRHAHRVRATVAPGGVVVEKVEFTDAVSGHARLCYKRGLDDRAHGRGDDGRARATDDGRDAGVGRPGVGGRPHDGRAAGARPTGHRGGAGRHAGGRGAGAPHRQGRPPRF